MVGENFENLDTTLPPNFFPFSLSKIAQLLFKFGQSYLIYSHFLNTTYCKSKFYK